MAYAQDTIISANAANALATALDALFTTAGWSTVETLTPSGTNTPTTKVYKSSGASNLCGYDWYCAVMYKAVGTEAQMRIIPGGAYNAGTHLLSQIPTTLGSPIGYADNITGDTFGTYDVNIATNSTTNVYSERGGSPFAQPWWSTIAPSSAFGYWASITKDHVALWTTIADGAPTPGPASFFASTLDVDPAWAALNSASFGNGVAVNPIMLASRGTALSVSLIGVSTSASASITPTNKIGADVGALLPTLTGNWLPSYAWRVPWYWLSASLFAGPSTPGWDNPKAGDGFHIGDGIDYYAVRGGSIGDTVTIAAATYVLSGLIGQQSLSDTDGVGVYLAVLVE